MNILYILCK